MLSFVLIKAVPGTKLFFLTSYHKKNCEVSITPLVKKYNKKDSVQSSCSFQNTLLEDNTVTNEMKALQREVGYSQIKELK